MVEPVSIFIIVIVAAVAAALKSTAGDVKVVSEISKKKSKAEKQNAEAAKGSAEKNSKRKLKAENNPSEQNAEAVAEISVPMMIPRSIPVFDGNDYETWRHMMKAYLISYDLWDSVENGCDKAKALKNDRKGFLAMLLIMQAVDP
nr:calmodulin-like protein 9 [Ipomoea batatas]